MEEKVDIVALGELLIDFTEAGHSQGGRKLFEQNPGGAPANLLTVASHFGYRTSFIGKVGNDMHGKFLKKTLQTEGINTDAIVEDPDYFTTLAFVEIGENGERNFSFARKPGADTQLKKEELDQTLISGCRIFHFGSLSLTDEPAESTTIEAVKMAKAAGALISYDPNYRPVHKIGDTLQACQLHAVAVFFHFLIHSFFCRCTACEKTLDHELQETIFS